MSGTQSYPLVAQIRDTIAVHGLAWAVRHYAKRIPRAEFRLFMVSAYCY